MLLRPISTFLAALALALAAPAGAQGKADARPVLGLMGTLPIYWGEAAGVGEVIDGTARPHWAKAELEREFRLQPFDVLDERALAGIDSLLLAQPRALTPEENVALDGWVRRGGRLLLFADPLFAGHSRFGLGDRRRAEGSVLLSPILSRWGLELLFDDSQQSGDRVALQDGQALPVAMAGHFALLEEAPPEGAACTLGFEDVVATCRLGQGRVLAVADAELLDLYEPSLMAAPALQGLLRRIFS